MRSLCSLLLVLCSAAFAFGQNKTVLRYVEFRDGSIIRLPVVEESLKLTLVRGTGKIDESTVPLSIVQNLELTQSEDFAKKRNILSAVQQLGSDEFAERERAYHTLLKMGPGIRADLQACQQLTNDVETRVRIFDLLNVLPKPAGANVKFSVAFDRVYLRSESVKFAGWGFLADQPIHVVAGGRKYALGRKDVRRLSATSLSVIPGTEGAVDLGFQQIPLDEFPKQCVEEGFETDPQSGRKLQVGENVEKLFIKNGFVLSTSVQTSHVSVNTFSVAGKSRGWSIANHNPLWQGEITVRFVRPGFEHIPSTVTYFGCYIAAVVPNGTHLIAYDRHGNKIGQIATQKNNTDFLGVRSVVPMHKIRIVPNQQLDRDYTLDDFIFLPTPTAAAQGGHPSKISVQLAKGDLVLCKNVLLEKDKIQLKQLPAGLPDFSLTPADVRRIGMPRKENSKPVAGMFAELEDGSIIFAPTQKDRRQRPVFARKPNLLKDNKGMIGLWTTDHAGMAYKPKDAKTSVIWSYEKQSWQPISELRFLEELVMWKGAEGKFASTGYERLPPIWLAMPKKEPAHGRWHVNTVQGEDLVLSGDRPFSGELTKGLRVVWQGQELQLPAAEISSLYFVPMK